ncbi:SPOR domain-containing protein [Immundisolibacter sp.]|uniref:SPOR domain-containing protein n=1 Tax=Immundisolibacter sp. TaxID=1934948 RepID=UPI002631DB70|nr:SPOR domain-containing protein [Immundisolibacter sp.]MDD3650970.1 SPOR domain-containing protein [Immundisolibacter sp.]
MEQARLKYRIVGGVVLLALAAILVPVLNDVRKPLPQGPQAIDIPHEPADGMAARLTAEQQAPQDVPEPLPPPQAAEDAQSASAIDEPVASAATPAAPLAAAPVATPEPTKPVAKAPPAVKPAAVTASAAKAEPVKSAPTKPAVTAPAATATPKPATVTAPAAKAEPVKPAPAKPVVTAAASASATAKPSSAAAPTPVQQAWVVQLGVYGNLKTAIDLREQLRRAGYSAFTEEVSTPQGKALRVRVGPELDRAAAQALLARLQRETGHQGMVMSYP